MAIITQANIDNLSSTSTPADVQKVVDELMSALTPLDIDNSDLTLPFHVEAEPETPFLMTLCPDVANAQDLDTDQVPLKMPPGLKTLTVIGASVYTPADSTAGGLVQLYITYKSGDTVPITAPVTVAAVNTEYVFPAFYAQLDRDDILSIRCDTQGASEAFSPLLVTLLCSMERVHYGT